MQNPVSIRRLSPLRKLIDRLTSARVEYRSIFRPLGVSFREYCDYRYINLEPSQGDYRTRLFGVDIKRIHSVSYVHTVEGIFVEELYKFPSASSAPFIIDAGANMGLSIIYFKRLYPDAEIVAFEPDPAIYQACQENVRAFGFTDVELVNAAVWTFDGELSFLPDDGLGGMVVDSASGGKATKVSAVDLIPHLDSRVDLLKLDIEGAELEVLRHCQHNLGSVENLFVEYHSAIGRPQQLSELLTILTNAGFRYYIKAAWDYMAHPFVDHRTAPVHTHDLQLNIFAYRV